MFLARQNNDLYSKTIAVQIFKNNGLLSNCSRLEKITPLLDYPKTTAPLGNKSCLPKHIHGS